MSQVLLLLAVSASIGAEVPVQPQGKPRLVLEAGMHLDRIVSVLFTPDGKRLITVSEDKTIRFWNAATGEPVKVLRPPIGLGIDGRLRAAALSPDGNLLAVGGFGIRGKAETLNPTYLIDLRKDAIIHINPGTTAPVYVLAFSPDRKQLAIAGYNDGLVRIMDVPTARQQSLLEMKKNQRPRRLVFSPDGKHLAVTTMRGGDLHMFHVATGKAGVTPDSLGPTFDLAWSPNGKTMATAHQLGLALWNTDGTLRRVDLVRS